MCWVAGDEEIPFYVGQTKSIWGRLNDYYWAEFQASTDFRVGEAVKYLSTQDLRVVARYEASSDRNNEENKIIRQLRAEGRHLLNDCRSYDYKIAAEAEERLKLHKFIDDLVEHARHNHG